MTAWLLENPSGEQADAIRHALNALHNMRDVFEREEVDLYDFALMRTFVTALPTESQALWNTYRVQRKQEYLLKCESAAKEGKVLPEWKAGMVENHDQFDSWLRLLSAQFSQPAPTMDQTDETPVSSASNFAVVRNSAGQEECFMCSPHLKNHTLDKCRKVLAMSSKAWKAACYEKSRCVKCTKAFQKGHECLVVCSYCQGNRYEVGHPWVMCPKNPARRGRMEKRDKSLSSHMEANPPPRAKRARAGKNGDEPVAKWAKDLMTQMRSLTSHLNQANQSDKKESKKAEKRKK